MKTLVMSTGILIIAATLMTGPSPVSAQHSSAEEFRRAELLRAVPLKRSTDIDLAAARADAQAKANGKQSTDVDVDNKLSQKQAAIGIGHGGNSKVDVKNKSANVNKNALTNTNTLTTGDITNVLKTGDIVNSNVNENKQVQSAGVPLLKGVRIR